MKDFSFQGKVYLGARLTGGKPGALRWVGDAPVCSISMTTESENRKESYTGNRLTSAILQLGNEAEVSLTLNWADGENLALGLYGTVNTITGATATDEAMPDTLAVGDKVVLDHGDISALTITDSTGTPATLVDGTDYEIESASGGVINILNLGSYTQPLKASYTYGDAVDVTMFTSAAPERYLLLDGINTVDGSRVKLRLYRVKFNPASSIPAINESFGQLELTGAVLFDSEADLNSALGGFGKIELPAAA